MKKKIIISILIVVILIIGGLVAYKLFHKKEEVPEVKTIEVLDKITNYEYHLEDRDNEIYKDNFLKLKDLLEKEEIDYQEYASLITKLFLIDLYTIENKISKYDIGSLEFIYPEEKEKFQKKVMDTIYKLVEDNSFNTRKQELPVVKDVEVTDINNTKYKKGEVSLEGYKVSATIYYQKDLGYDKKVDLTLVKDENKVYVVNLVTD